MPQTKENFKAAEVDLIANAQGVEASAGTGKTYSIALLAVRLLLKTDIQINQILMVTFTRAAVAELQLRVRAFVRKALQVARDPQANINNEELKSLVLEVINEAPESREAILLKLEQSSILLEDLPVFTIHGFCGRLLKEYAFETLQVFDADVLSESQTVGLTQEYFHEFWRSEVATLPVGILRELLELETGNGKYHKSFRDIIFNLVRAGLAGKEPFSIDDSDTSSLGSQRINALNKLISDYGLMKERLLVSVEKNKDLIMSLLSVNKGVYLLQFLQKGNFVSALNYVIDNWKPEGGVKFLSEVSGHIEGWAEFQGLKNKIREFILAFASVIAGKAYRFVSGHLKAARMNMAATTFDDMIIQVRNAVESPEHLEILQTDLRAKYRAVFIDEFQDTDINQYVIFNKLFGQNHYLYYIGDPKQSIYEFRKADVHTYLKAMDDVSVLHRMNVNFRSNNDYIEAMNRFFLPDDNFQTFGFSDHKIRYYKVEAPPDNQKPVLYCGGKKVCPLLLSAQEDEYERIRALRATVHDLLNPKKAYEFRSPGKSEKVSCRDISILVRTKEMGRTIAEILSSDGLPVVTVSDKKIFQTPEAEEIWQILAGIHELTFSSINRAMVTKIAGQGTSSLLKIKQESIMERFRKYNDTWKAEGVYVMMQQFMADHNLHTRFYNESQLALERTIANMMQLVDLIHTHASELKLDQTDQLRWLRLSIDGADSDDDEFVQRLERDEDAIRIVTIHSSKGLEYPIILCPDLEFKVKTESPFVSYRDENSGEFVSGDRRFLNEQYQEKILLADEQQEQEFRRLLYVAITRARQACFIFYDAKKTNTIQQFTGKIDLENPSEYIQPWSPPPMQRRPRRKSNGGQQTAGINTAAVYSPKPNTTITDLSWRKVSFTRLTPEKETERLPQASEDTDDIYNDFAFRKLRRGAQTGNLLHAILEAIDFTKPDGWEFIIKKMMRRYLHRSSEEYEKGIATMINHLTKCEPGLLGGYGLSEIKWENRLVELEFDLDLKKFNLNGLEALSTAEIPLAASLGREDNFGLEGILNGFMDLFFEFQGKFYILDWKSNYLGDKISDYSSEKLAEAMSQNNYHLQYMLYTVAACRYLKIRLEKFSYKEHFGGVIYLFVRGVRKDGNEGIYFTIPNENTIEAIDKLFRGAE